MTVVRILADDPTGALDSASQFAAGRCPVPVFWNGAGSGSGSYAIDTETREGDEARAVDQVARAADAFRGADLCFKKVDSLLRGHPAAEIAACYTRGGFGSAVVAPAFAAQRRITRGGRQFYRDRVEDRWRPVGGDFAAALAKRGAGPRLADRPSRIGGGGVFLCDAESDDDLAAIVAQRFRIEPPVLWCGSAGLAMALVGRRQRACAVAGPLCPLFLIVGSDAPNARRQVAVLERHHCGCVEKVCVAGPGTAPSVGSVLADRLHDRRVAALVFAFPDRTPRPIAGRTISRVLGGTLPRLPRPGCVFVSGGDTLHRLCRELGATCLEVLGDMFPGVPLSRFRDGAWKDVPLVTKSGGFGDPDILSNIIERTRELSHDRP